ncbi:hypothetical protein KUTeg_017360, partial [Tegillarca granosa]
MSPLSTLAVFKDFGISFLKQSVPVPIPAPRQRPVISIPKPVPAPRQRPELPRPIPAPRNRAAIPLPKPVQAPRNRAAIPLPKPVPAPRQRPELPRPIPAPRNRAAIPLLKPVPAPRVRPEPERHLNNISINDEELHFERTVHRGRDWQCAVRQKTKYCSASVREREDKFFFGKQYITTRVSQVSFKQKKITAKVKDESVNNVFVSAATIAEKILFTMGDTELPPASRDRPKLANLKRIANRAREQLRPKEPKDCDFEICNAFIPDGFLRRDIHHDSERHIVFATDEQLSVLCDLQTWFVVKHPFYQLFSVHGFISENDNSKQVFDAIINLLPRRSAVQTIVADFEKATWAAVRQAIPGVTVRGCHFHWSQAIWRKVQEVGLQ